MRNPNYYHKEKVRKYIVDINNKLFELKNELCLDIPEIRKIRDAFDDDAKKEIIDMVKEQEAKKEEIRRMSLIASGIDDIVSDKEPIKYSEYVAEEINRSINNGGLLPPKTDWKRVDVSKDEKQKILESIKANPRSNVFSKDFKWNPKDFLSAFLYLENNSGPFMVSVVSEKEELEKYSKIPEISEGISQMCVGKFVLLSIYDITATTKESKYIYMGFKYSGLTGTLEFHSIGSVNGSVTNSQKRIAMEFMDEMKISYQSNHKDLTA